MKATPSIRIAMWSGPRNISTALMRAWENRPDTVVVDEPFYAYYLQKTGADHPGAEEVIAQGETDWRKVVEQLQQEPSGDRTIFYQKQMTHHLLPEVSRAWLEEVRNAFLIRHPAEVIASYLKKNHDPSLADLGFTEQAQIFELVREQTGTIPPVIDAHDVLENPAQTLVRFCEVMGVPFNERMLSWPPGLRPTDGIWAKHWYAEVEKTTSFRSSTATVPEVPERLRAIHDRCLEIYENLHRHRLR